MLSFFATKFPDRMRRRVALLPSLPRLGPDPHEHTNVVLAHPAAGPHVASCVLTHRLMMCTVRVPETLCFLAQCARIFAHQSAATFVFVALTSAQVLVQLARRSTECACLSVSTYPLPCGGGCSTAHFTTPSVLLCSLRFPSGALAVGFRHVLFRRSCWCTHLLRARHSSNTSS